VEKECKTELLVVFRVGGAKSFASRNGCVPLRFLSVVPWIGNVSSWPEVGYESLRFIVGIGLTTTSSVGLLKRSLRSIGPTVCRSERS
jgi:hypothetical protein